MARPQVLIFHRPAGAGEPELARFLANVREELIERQSRMFRAAGAAVRVHTAWRGGMAFGELLAELSPLSGGVVVMSGGAVARLNRHDAEALVTVAASGQRHALTNNRYSSDVCAVGDASVLRDLPPLPSDNALPRWLEERAGFSVAELPGRERLALDIDTPLDIALWALARGCPAWAGRLVEREGIAVPRLDELRALSADPHAELVVFGRAGSATLRWLERNVRCRVRFLAEERGLRAASPLAIGASEHPPAALHVRGPRATLGMLLDRSGPRALGDVVDELADGAIIDSRVLLAHRLGADEAAWPAPAERFASDLLRPAEVGDRWLRTLTEAAATSRVPILLGAHTLVGPGVRLVLHRPALPPAG